MPIPVEFQLEFSNRMLLGVPWAPWNGRTNPTNSHHPSKSRDPPRKPPIPPRAGCQEAFPHPRVAGKRRRGMQELLDARKNQHSPKRAGNGS